MRLRGLRVQYAVHIPGDLITFLIVYGYYRNKPNHPAVYGYKFDFRLYVLVSSFWPLRCYIHKVHRPYVCVCLYVCVLVLSVVCA